MSYVSSIPFSKKTVDRNILGRLRKLSKEIKSQYEYFSLVEIKNLEQGDLAFKITNEEFETESIVSFYLGKNAMYCDIKSDSNEDGLSIHKYFFETI